MRNALFSVGDTVRVISKSLPAEVAGYKLTGVVSAVVGDGAFVVHKPTWWSRFRGAKPVELGWANFELAPLKRAQPD